MKNRILLLISTFLFFILIFIIEKVFFMLINNTSGITPNDVAMVVLNGLPLDLSMSGYLTVLPALLTILSIWIVPNMISKIFNAYFAIVLVVIAIIAVTDIILYPYWGFHFDSTVFLYLKSPKEAFASASAIELIVGVTATIASIVALYMLYVLIIKRQILNLKVPRSIKNASIALLVLTALLFIPIRGGFTVSTMNIGKVYFSDNMFLNHAAINPQFNLMYSALKAEDFANKYQFYDKEQIAAIIEDIHYHEPGDSITSVLNSERPNIIMFILESFSAEAIKDTLVAPNMHRIAQEGISFSNFYANSFRTDRGLVSILSGYPAQPTAAIMKYPQKTRSLPAIPKSLRENGYDLSFYYGGDADFANMRSYFIGCCNISNITSDKDFSVSERLTKWGVRDDVLLEKVYADIANKKHAEPFFSSVLTLSSHEPFDVPTRRFDDPFLNSLAFTDSCIGNFVEKLKATDLWQNTLILLVADHCMQSYPTGAENSSPERFRIPMVWTGGAVKDSASIVQDFGSQNDIAATLLSQMKINYNEFKFSKDMFNTGARKFAFYSYVDGFSMLDSDGMVIYDNSKGSIIREEGEAQLERTAKVYFQNMYLDLDAR